MDILSTCNKIRLANNLEDIIKVLVYGYFTEANCKYLNKIFMCYFYNITIAIMSDNRGSDVMLYFTDEVF